MCRVGSAVRRTRGRCKLTPQPGHFRDLQAHSRRTVAKHSRRYAFPPGPSCSCGWRRRGGSSRVSRKNRWDGRGDTPPLGLCSPVLSQRLWRPTPRPSWSWRSPGASCVVSLIPCGHACFSPAVMPAVLCPRSSRPARLSLRRASAVQGLEQHRRRRVPGGDARQAPGAALLVSPDSGDAQTPLWLPRLIRAVLRAPGRSCLSSCTPSIC